MKGGVSTAFPVMGVVHSVAGRLGAACSCLRGHAAGAVATHLPYSPGRAVAKLLAHPNTLQEPSENTSPGPATGQVSKETLVAAPSPGGLAVPAAKTQHVQVARPALLPRPFLSLTQTHVVYILNTEK